MKRGFMAFIAGVAVGAVMGILVGDEEKKRVQKILSKQAERLRKEYERPMKEGAAKVRRFVKEHLRS